jgi:hypothetical protein
LLASHPIELESGLLSAGFWNYLREDITVALIEKRNIMVSFRMNHWECRLNATMISPMASLIS